MKITTPKKYRHLLGKKVMLSSDINPSILAGANKIYGITLVYKDDLDRISCCLHSMHDRKTLDKGGRAAFEYMIDCIENNKTIVVETAQTAANESRASYGSQDALQAACEFK